MRTLIIARTDGATIQGKGTRSGYFLSYKFPTPLKFDEPHVARLITVTGITHTLMVFADFVADQPMDGESRQLLGIKSSTSTSFWVPIIADSPPEGFFRLRTTTGAAIPANPRIIVVAEIAPASDIYGASSTSGV
jgi:hypothetical protein